jgi:hypothetical protein
MVHKHCSRVPHGHSQPLRRNIDRAGDRQPTTVRIPVLGPEPDVQIDDVGTLGRIDVARRCRITLVVGGPLAPRFARAL